MRIVVDIQGGQSTGSRARGIGRYTLALTGALLRHRGAHEVLLLANARFPDTIESMRAHFAALLPSENLVVWTGMPGVAGRDAPESDWRRNAAELLREACISRLRPDVVLVTSLFEGLTDDAATSVGRLVQGIPTALVLYDLIPLVHRELYLVDMPTQDWYERKLAGLRRADLLLAISDSTRNEAIRCLLVDPDSCVSISTAADPRFRPVEYGPVEEADIRHRHGLARPFIMYTGGIDHRKNVERLVGAFARLPHALRDAHQLVIVCAIGALDRQRLSRLAASLGLREDMLVMPGFVTDDDLVALYNLCQLFVFPSWHEGFGLPALEAMSCGRAVLAANTSSLPEVLGREDALFDPFDEQAMANKIGQVLQDPSLRKELERHALDRAQSFSWDVTALATWSALEGLLRRPDPSQANARQLSVPLPRLAFVAPLQPAQTGVSDYVAELLPELARHYRIEVVSDQLETTDAWARAHGPVRSPQWLELNADRIERVLYHFGNALCHGFMFDLLAKVPGTVVLHDFFLGHLVQDMHASQRWQGDRALSLYREHGCLAARAALDAQTSEAATWTYPCNERVLQQARGVIVHSRASCELARSWHGGAVAERWAVVPHLRAPSPSLSRAQARLALGLAQDDLLVCSFGIVGPAKLNLPLLEAWLQSTFGQDHRCQLVFVGDNGAGDYSIELEKRARATEAAPRIKFTGWVDTATYRQYLAAADLAVQLRAHYRGETSGAVLDCMNAGVATIVNAHRGMAEMAADLVWTITDDFAIGELRSALETLGADAAARARLARRAQDAIRQQHAPANCALQYMQAIERFWRDPVADTGHLATAVAGIEPGPGQTSEWLQYAQAAALSLPAQPAQRQLLVDVSVLAKIDARTGIQRVVRAVLRQWLGEVHTGLRIEPIYAAEGGIYRYARRFTLRFLGVPARDLAEDPIEARAGDIYLALDLDHEADAGHREFLRLLRTLGVTVKFVVYDLLPVQRPERFPAQAAALHHQWLLGVAQGDGAVCISRTVADELFDWLQVFGPPRARPFAIDWFRLGADIGSPEPVTGVGETTAAQIKEIQAGDALLMVGTVEPRKRHGQALEAFEQLWAGGSRLMLVVAGKPGWDTEGLQRRLRGHVELGRRLFWFEDASDALLGQLYRKSKGLLAASEAEGFGLQLVEAAYAGLPILARNIPVFREVAGDCATYFDADDAEGLAGAIQAWAGQRAKAGLPASSGIQVATWFASARTLLARLHDAPPYRQWPAEIDHPSPAAGHRFWMPAAGGSPTDTVANTP